MAKKIRITAKRDGFRRAGIAHPATPVDHEPGTFTKQQFAELMGEPMLVVQEVEVPDEEGDPADANTDVEKLSLWLRPEDFTSAGVPKTEAVTRILGRPVTAAERDQLWAAAQGPVISPTTGT